MKKIMGRLLTLVLSMVLILSSFTISAYAKGDKSAKAAKKASDVIPQTAVSAAVWEGAVSRKEASRAALDAAGVDEAALKYLTCYVVWTNHVPAAYEVKFATRWAAYRYTVDLDTGDILDSVCHSPR